MLIPRTGMTFQREGTGSAMEGRDRSILQLVAEGESYEEAAGRLRLDLTGIERAMERIRRHLGAHTDEHAVALALRSHLID